MKRRFWKLAPVFAAVVAAGLAGQAQAVPQSYALSYDNLYNGQVVFLLTGGATVSVGIPTPTSSSTAQLNGSGPSQGGSGVSDAPVSVCPGGVGCGPGGSLPGAAPVNNAFVDYGQAASAGFNYGWGDAHIVSEQNVAPCKPQPSSTGATCFHAVNEGEASVTAGNQAVGQGNNGSGTELSLVFTVGVGTATIDIQINADPYLQAFLDSTSLGAPDQARATLTANASITNLTSGVQVFSWAPNGTGTGANGGTIVTDPFSLNVSRLVNAAGGGNSIYNPCNFLVPPTGQGTPACGVGNQFEVFASLAPGTYELDLTAQELTNVNRVPEPTSIALLGLGMAALGLMRRRKADRKADLSAA